MAVPLVLCVGLAGCTRSASSPGAVQSGGPIASVQLQRLLTAPDTVTDEELVAEMTLGAEPALRLAAMRTLHDRGAGVEATRAFLAATTTGEALRLKAVGGLAELTRRGHGEAVEVLRSYLAGSPPGESRRALQVIAESGGPQVVDAVVSAAAGATRR